MTISNIALISMPWMIASMPSIQLALLSGLLQERGVSSVRYELFLDFASEIGFPLYERVSAGSSLVPEWTFARSYFKDGKLELLDAFLHERHQHPVGGASLPNSLLEYMSCVADDFIEQWASQLIQARHNIFAFSLTISQTCSSLALARAIKKRSPQAFIIFGGSSCAGPMGRAILQMSDAVDVTVSGEAEYTIDTVLELASGVTSTRVREGVNYREGNTLSSYPARSLHRLDTPRSPLNYDSYFARLRHLGLQTSVLPWLPVESSRGCWYGEKAQCTFCGLHEIMSYRERPVEAFVEELQFLSERHDTSKFFAVDLIMPHSYFRRLPIELSNRNLEVEVFYEVKANMRKEPLKALRATGLTWIQPGIESLDDDLLKAMRKGVSAAQNIYLLRCCKELKIDVTWSMMTGIPSESIDSYIRMTELVPKLYHLPPPSGCTLLEMHRFSPYFNDPKSFGITGIRPHPLYKFVFPIPDGLLADLVYLHEFNRSKTSVGTTTYKAFVEEISRWRSRYKSGSALTGNELFDGSMEIQDTRQLDSAHTIRLTPNQTRLLEYLQAPVPLAGLRHGISSRLSDLTESDTWVSETVDFFLSAGLCVLTGGRLISIVCCNEREENYGTSRRTEAA